MFADDVESDQVVSPFSALSLTSVSHSPHKLKLLTKSDNELHMMGCITQISADESDRLYRTILSPL